MPLLCVLSLVSQQMVSIQSLSYTMPCQCKLYFHAGSIPVVRSGLGSPANRSIIFLDNVVCSGRESNLTECDYSTINNCDRSEEAGVRYEGKTTHWFLLTINFTRGLFRPLSIKYSIYAIHLFEASIHSNVY